MANKNRSYTKEFKDSVLKRLDENETVTSVYANLKLGQLAHRKLGQYQYN